MPSSIPTKDIVFPKNDIKNSTQATTNKRVHFAQFTASKEPMRIESKYSLSISIIQIIYCLADHTTPEANNSQTNNDNLQHLYLMVCGLVDGRIISDLLHKIDHGHFSGLLLSTAPPPTLTNDHNNSNNVNQNSTTLSLKKNRFLHQTLFKRIFLKIISWARFSLCEDWSLVPPPIFSADHVDFFVDFCKFLVWALCKFSHVPDHKANHNLNIIHNQIRSWMQSLSKIDRNDLWVDFSVYDRECVSWQESPKKYENNQCSSKDYIYCDKSSAVVAKEGKVEAKEANGEVADDNVIIDNETMTFEISSPPTDATQNSANIKDNKTKIDYEQEYNNLQVLFDAINEENSILYKQLNSIIAAKEEEEAKKKKEHYEHLQGIMEQLNIESTDPKDALVAIKRLQSTSKQLNETISMADHLQLSLDCLQSKCLMLEEDLASTTIALNKQQGDEGEDQISLQSQLEDAVNENKLLSSEFEALKLQVNSLKEAKEKIVGNEENMNIELNELFHDLKNLKDELEIMHENNNELQKSNDQNNKLIATNHKLQSENEQLKLQNDKKEMDNKALTTLLDQSQTENAQLHKVNSELLQGKNKIAEQDKIVVLQKTLDRLEAEQSTLNTQISTLLTENVMPMSAKISLLLDNEQIAKGQQGEGLNNQVTKVAGNQLVDQQSFDPRKDIGEDADYCNELHVFESIIEALETKIVAYCGEIAELKAKISWMENNKIDTSESANLKNQTSEMQNTLIETVANILQPFLLQQQQQYTNSHNNKDNCTIRNTMKLKRSVKKKSIFIQKLATTLKGLTRAIETQRTNNISTNCNDGNDDTKQFDVKTIKLCKDAGIQTTDTTMLFPDTQQDDLYILQDHIDQLTITNGRLQKQLEAQQQCIEKRIETNSNHHLNSGSNKNVEMISGSGQCPTHHRALVDAISRKHGEIISLLARQAN